MSLANKKLRSEFALKIESGFQGQSHRRLCVDPERRRRQYIHTYSKHRKHNSEYFKGAEQ